VPYSKAFCLPLPSFGRLGTNAMALAPRAKLQVDVPLDAALSQLCIELQDPSSPSKIALASDRRSPSMAASGAILMRPSSMGNLSSPMSTSSSAFKSVPLGGIWWQKEERRRKGHGRTPDPKEQAVYRKLFAWPTDEEVFNTRMSKLPEQMSDLPEPPQADGEQSLTLPEALSDLDCPPSRDGEASPSPSEQVRKEPKKSRPSSKENMAIKRSGTSKHCKDGREVMLAPIETDARPASQRAESPEAEDQLVHRGGTNRRSSYSAQDRAVSSNSQGARRSSVAGIVPPADGTVAEPAVPKKRVEEPEVKPDISEAMLARKLGMPFDMTHEACVLFRQFSDYNVTENMLESRLNMDNFCGVLCELCKVGGIADLEDEFVRSAFKTADRDGGGDIDVEEFNIWYSSFGFSEEMNLTPADKELRDLSRALDIPLLDIERFSRAFKRFDLDGSGSIEFDEFSQLLYKLMKVPAGQVLPPDRVKKLWREADVDGSGDVNFAEFCHFYCARFDQQDGGSFDFSSFYSSVRRVSVFS